ncbi:maltose acetyltransferase domain-containing protein [uncultured Draconibacterium sp.]|uniref:maltose acetyltransferase domain-containing protein n=1 Tax=uncultured Draconibacterium sp. TaxID=1573823 RepID=UPI002AA85655|nr:maltose acetyltransferase domain-containing protein [uncultured Draconibacterium sp.]
MTEKEKARKGLLYNPNKNKELIAEILRCKQRCFEYNQTPFELEEEERTVLIKKIIGKTKGNPIVVSPFYCDYGSNIEMGENFFANHNLVLLGGAKITFGDNVFIGPNCCLSTAGHPIDKNQRNEGLEFACMNLGVS